MGVIARAGLRLLRAADEHPLPESLKIVIGVAAACAFGYRVVTGRADKRPGHDLASSERPQALRGEKERSLEEEKAYVMRRKAEKEKEKEREKEAGGVPKLA
jgi:hypothetical protein